MSHDTNDVMQPEYYPVGQEEELLFAKKNTFMYTVLIKKVLVPIGRHFIREHSRTGDAQAVFSKLYLYYRASTTAHNKKQTLMEAITTTRIGQIRWNKGYVAFILHFLDFFRQYEDITSDSEWFPDSMKLMFLQNAVKGVAHLDSIKTQFHLIHESSGQGPEFNQ